VRVGDPAILLGYLVLEEGAASPLGFCRVAEERQQLAGGRELPRAEGAFGWLLERPAVWPGHSHHLRASKWRLTAVRSCVWAGRWGPSGATWGVLRPNRSSPHTTDEAKHPAEAHKFGGWLVDLLEEVELQPQPW
jgi:hypothetical protein